MAQARGVKPVVHFLAGPLAGASAAILYESVVARRGLDPRLVRASREDPGLPATVLIPGILGSELIRPDGAEAWLNSGNAFGHHDLRLPLRLPLAQSRDALRPGGLVGVDSLLPRIFGFTEYADLLEFLRAAGFSRDERNGGQRGAIHHVFTYDWRRCIAEAARRLGEHLEQLADRRGEPDARFNLIGHSMGGLVARYYLRFGGAEPAPGLRVSWAGARRIANLIVVATPSGGSIPALDAVLHGDRVGLSSTTLAADVIARMPSIYQLLPPPEARPLVVPGAGPQAADLLDPAVWESHGWGPYARNGRPRGADGSRAEENAFLAAVLDRARLVREALARAPETACPARVLLLGGDCPPLARALVPEGEGLVRFQPASPEEADAMLEDGDGRVTRASALAAHLPQAEGSEHGCGIAEVRHAFFGAADHHGIYREPTFQSLLLRVLLRPLPLRSLDSPFRRALGSPPEAALVLDLFGKSDKPGAKPGPKGRPAGRGGSPAGAQARELIAKKSYAKAIELLRVELTRRRGDERLRIQLADVLALAGRKDEAIEMLNVLSDDLALGGQAAKAIAALKRIQQIEPGRADVEEKLSYLILHQSRPSFDPWTKAKKQLEPVAIIDARGEGSPGPGFGMEEIAEGPAIELGAGEAPASADQPAATGAAAEAPAPGEPAEAPSLAELFGDEQAKDALVGMLEDVFTPVAGPAEPAPGESKLADTPLFRDFSQEELVAVIRGLRLHTYGPGEIVCSAGEPGDSLFILTTGSVRAYMRDKRGKHVQVREMSEGEFFGEMSVLTGNPRSATITCAGDCELLKLDRLTLNQISSSHPNVRQVLQDFYKKRASHSIEAAIGQAPA